jgi:AhpD family alkylhydroperoxidase
MGAPVLINETWYYPEKHHDLQVLLGRLSHEMPGTTAGFARLHKEAMTAGTLNAKFKELIALAIAVALRCDDCISYHVHDAMKARASPALPLATAAASFGLIFSSISPVAIRMTWTALPITSAGRFSPLGPRAILFLCQFQEVFRLLDDVNSVVFSTAEPDNRMAIATLPNKRLG